MAEDPNSSGDEGYSSNGEDQPTRDDLQMVAQQNQDIIFAACVNIAVTYVDDDRKFCNFCYNGAYWDKKPEDHHINRHMSYRHANHIRWLPHCDECGRPAYNVTVPASCIICTGGGVRLDIPNDDDDDDEE
jgi:hypothetical protein